MKAVAYLRIVPADAVDPAPLEAARRRVAQIWESTLKPSGCDLGRTFEEEPRAWNTPLRKRFTGQRFSVAAGRGDVMIIPALNRSFANTKDLLESLDIWTGRGVRVLVPDLGLDTGSPAHAPILQLVRTVCEFNRRARGDAVIKRVRAHQAAGKLHGRPPWGTRAVGSDHHGNRRLEIIPEEYAIGLRIHAWRSAGWDWMQIWKHLLNSGVNRKRGRGRQTRKQERKWTFTACQFIFKKFLRLEQLIADGKLKRPDLGQKGTPDALAPEGPRPDPGGDQHPVGPPVHD